MFSEHIAILLFECCVLGLYGQLIMFYLRVFTVRVKFSCIFNGFGVIFSWIKIFFYLISTLLCIMWCALDQSRLRTLSYGKQISMLLCRRPKTNHFSGSFVVLCRDAASIATPADADVRRMLIKNYRKNLLLCDTFYHPQRSVVV